MPSMTVTAYLNDKDRVTFACPACNKTYRRNLSKVPDAGPGSKLRCRCTCKHAFVITLERRKHFRKSTDINGGYLQERHQFRGLFTLKNISQSGAGILIHTSRALSTGDNMLLKFNLDDEDHTYIAREAIVRKKEGDYLGVEFLAQTWDDDPITRYINQ